MRICHWSMYAPENGIHLFFVFCSFVCLFVVVVVVVVAVFLSCAFLQLLCLVRTTSRLEDF